VQLHLHVGSSDVRFGALLALLASLMMMTGIAVFFGLLLLSLGPPGQTGADLIVVCGIVYGGLCVFVTAIIYRLRRRFFRLSPQWQIGIAIMAWAWHLAIVASYAFVIT
jgi:hypothetical protein